MRYTISNVIKQSFGGISATVTSEGFSFHCAVGHAINPIESNVEAIQNCLIEDFKKQKQQFLTLLGIVGTIER